MQMIGLTRFFHGIAVNTSWAAKGQINSGNQTVTISTPLVQSASIIQLTRIGSGAHLQAISVDSQIEGSSFQVRCDSGASTANIPFYWMLMRL